MAPALIVGGAVAYALVRYSYGRFYGVFGLSPEDAGVGEVSALVGSGLGLTYVALFVFCLFALTIGAVRAAVVFVAKRRTRYERLIKNERADEVTPDTQRLRLLAPGELVLLLGALLVAAWVYGALKDKGLRSAWREVVVALLVGGVLLLSPLVRGVRSRARVFASARGNTRPDPADLFSAIASTMTGVLACFVVLPALLSIASDLVLRLFLFPREASYRLSSILFWVLFAYCVDAFYYWRRQEKIKMRNSLERWALVVVPALLLFIVVPDLARRVGTCVSRGGATSGLRTRQVDLFGSLDYLGVRAQPVTLSWIGALPRGVHHGDGYIFLADQQGTDIVWNIRRRSLMRFPSQRAIVSTVSTPSRCEAN